MIRSGVVETAAALDANGIWRATDVPLQPGDNTLVAVLTESDGTTVERTIAAVQSRPILSVPSGVVFDEANARVIIVDAKQVLTFDPAAGALEVLSSSRTGSGPNFVLARHLALAADGAILVSDFRRVLRVDANLGERTEHVIVPDGSPINVIARDASLNRLLTVGFANDLHVADLFETPPISAVRVSPLPPIGVFVATAPTDAVYVAANDTVYAANSGGLGIWAIEAATGDAELIPTTGAGLFPVPTPSVGVDYDVSQGRLLVLGLSGQVSLVDPLTAVVTDTLFPPAPSSDFRSLSGLSLGDGRLWTVSPTAGELISIDVSTGTQTIEAMTGVGSGEAPGIMLAGRYDEAGDRFVAVSDLRLIAVDPIDGSRELLANFLELPLALGPSPSLQPSILLANGIALSQDGARAWLTDAFPGAVYEVDLASGDHREISGPNVGAGPLPGQISGIAIDPSESFAYVVDRFVRRVLRVDLATGQRELLPDFAAGLDLTEIRGLELDAAGNRLVMYLTPSTPAAAAGPGIYAVDLASFDLALLADLSGTISPFDSASTPGLPTTQMSLSADGRTLFFPVVGDPTVPYVRVDLELGDVVPLGDASSGPPFFLPNAIDIAADGRLFGLDASSALYVIDAESGERTIASK